MSMISFIMYKKDEIEMAPSCLVPNSITSGLVRFKQNPSQDVFSLS